VNQRELERTLTGAANDEDAAARGRAWDVVQAAYRGREPVPRARRRIRPVALLAVLALVAGAAAAAATTPHSGVGRLVRDVLGIGEPHARPALVRVPGGGRLLVQSGQSTWLVQPGGTRRRLGSYDGAAWSPRGLFVVAWRGGVLTATEPSGRVHWSLSRPSRIAAARWSPVDGFRIAYLTGGSLRVVNGDGSGDHRFGAADAGVAPAWRPDNAHVLAYVDARQRVTVAAVDLRRRLWRSDPIPGALALSWSPGGRRLLVVAPDRAVVYGAAGHTLAVRRSPGLRTGVWSSRGSAVAVVRRDARAGVSQLLLLDAGRGLRGGALFTGPGRFGAPAWAPSGRSLLLPWPSAGQWLFLDVRRTARPAAVGNIAAQFAPGARHPEFPSSVQRCCR
jgi:hypothetical protein